MILQEFCATTGHSPPYAAYLLRTFAKGVALEGVTLVPPSPLVQGEECFPTRPSPSRRKRKRIYGPAVVEVLIWVYHLAGELCGKRLQAAMPEFLHALERTGTLLPFAPHAALLCVSSATMDGLLREEKAKEKDRKHRPRTRPGSLLGLIPVLSFRELSAASPGSVEVDLVSHDGEGRSETTAAPSLSRTAVRGGRRSSLSPTVRRSMSSPPSLASSPTCPFPSSSCTRTMGVSSSMTT